MNTSTSVTNPTTGDAKIWNKNASPRKPIPTPPRVASIAACGVCRRMLAAKNAHPNSSNPPRKHATNPACQAKRSGSGIPRAKAN